MAEKMFFIKVPEDITEQEMNELTDMFAKLADETERKGKRWGFAIIPERYDSLAHGEIQTFLHELLKVVKEQIEPEKLLEIMERSLLEPGQ